MACFLILASQIFTRGEDVKKLFCFLTILFVTTNSFSNINTFKVMHYNILAKHLGNNFEPWFMYSDLMEGDEYLDKCDLVKEIMYCQDCNGGYLYPSLRKIVDRLKLGSNGEYQEDTCQNPYRDLFDCKYLQSLMHYQNEYFSWKKRLPKILTRIDSENPDILSLVELDAVHEIGSSLQEKGYQFVYAKRPKSADGIGIFFKRSLFSSEGHDIIHFKSGKENHNRIALLVRLKHQSSDAHILFVSTHLMREPEDLQKEGLRVQESIQLLNKITSIADKMTEPYHVIITGDLNADQNSRTLEVFRSNGYKTATQKNADLITSVTCQRKMKLDYILFNSEDYFLEVTNLSELMNVPNEGPIPNKTHGSDHLPLVANFKY